MKTKFEIKQEHNFKKEEKALKKIIKFIENECEFYDEEEMERQKTNPENQSIFENTLILEMAKKGMEE